MQRLLLLCRDKEVAQESAMRVNSLALWLARTARAISVEKIASLYLDNIIHHT